MNQVFMFPLSANKTKSLLIKRRNNTKNDTFFLHLFSPLLLMVASTKYFTSGIKWCSFWFEQDIVEFIKTKSTFSCYWIEGSGFCQYAPFCVERCVVVFEVQNVLRQCWMWWLCNNNFCTFWYSCSRSFSGSFIDFGSF